MLPSIDVLSGLPLSATIILFAFAVGAITLAGLRTARLGALLAARTRLGEAMMGALLIGAVTSLPGSIASILAAAEGLPSLSISNGLGGIAAQTAFLAIADITYRRANLEHAAAAPENLTQGALVIVLLGVVLLAIAAPPFAVFGVNPASIALIAIYLFGLKLIAKARDAPMWNPRKTRETRNTESESEGDDRTPLLRLWLLFAFWVCVLALSGFAIAQSAISIMDRTGLSETLTGAAIVAVATSMPEFIIALGAVRRGALTLAVGNIIGGNAYDVLFASFSDIAYRDGSIYHAITAQDRFVVALTLVMTGVLLLGMLRRETHGPGNIGFESITILALYAGGLAVIAL